MLDIHLVLRDVVRCEEELLGKLPDGTGDGTDDVREAPDEDGNQTRLVVLQRNRDQLHEGLYDRIRTDCRCWDRTGAAASEGEHLVRTLELRLRALRGQGDGGARGAKCSDEHGQLHNAAASPSSGQRTPPPPRGCFAIIGAVWRLQAAVSASAATHTLGYSVCV